MLIVGKIWILIELKTLTKVENSLNIFFPSEKWRKMFDDSHINFFFVFGGVENDVTLLIQMGREFIVKMLKAYNI